jgi:hypothetical protein
MTAVTPTSMCELNSRVSNRIEVRLMWCREDGRLWVTVTDGRKGESFQLPVADEERAMDVFHHPFAYAAHHGVTPQPTTRSHAVEPHGGIAVCSSEPSAACVTDSDAAPA